MDHTSFEDALHAAGFSEADAGEYVPTLADIALLEDEDSYYGALDRARYSWQIWESGKHRFCLAESTRDKARNVIMTGGAFLDRFTESAVRNAPGVKEGTCYMQTLRKADDGVLTPRTEKTSGEVGVIAVDIDKGGSWPAAVATLDALGWGGWVHLSFTSGTELQDIVDEKSFNTWLARGNRVLSLETVKEFMRGKGFYGPFVDTAKAFDYVDGRLKVLTAPITKMRLVLPLSEPVALTVDELSLIHRLVGALFDVTIDSSVSNKLSQPLYFPRRPRNKVYKLALFKRSLVDPARLIAFANEVGITARDNYAGLGGERRGVEQRQVTVSELRSLGDDKVHAETMRATVQKFQSAFEAGSLILAYCGADVQQIVDNEDPKPSLAKLNLQAVQKVTGSGVTITVAACPLRREHGNADDEDEISGKNKPVAYVNASDGEWHRAGAGCFHDSHDDHGLWELIKPVLDFLELEDLREFILEHERAEFDAYIARLPRTRNYITAQINKLGPQDGENTPKLEAIFELIARHNGMFGESDLIRAMAAKVCVTGSDGERREAQRALSRSAQNYIRRLRADVKAADREAAKEEMRAGVGTGDLDFAYMDERYCVLFEASRSLVVHTPPAPRACVFRNKRDLEEIYYANDPRFTNWLHHPDRRNYDAWQFRPAEGLEFEEDGMRILNRWRGFTTTPVAASVSGKDYQRLRAHLLDNICDGDARLAYYLWTYTCHMFQKPEELPGVYIVLYSSENGTGKSLFTTLVRSLLGKAGGKIARQSDITGTFNTLLQDKVMLVGEELGSVYDPAGRGIVKDQASAETITIHNKFRDPQQDVPNFCRMWFCTNHLHAVYVEHGERRAAVTQVGAKRAKDRTYFGEMLAEWRDGGREAFLYDMLNYPLSKYIDPCTIPLTIHLEDQKEMSMPGVDAFLFDMLTEGSFATKEGMVLAPWTKNSQGKLATPLVSARLLGDACQAYMRAHRMGDKYKPTLLKKALVGLGAQDKQRSRDKAQVLGWLDTAVCPDSYRLRDLDQMRQAFADKWNIPVGDARPLKPVGAKGGTDEAISYNLPEDELKAFVAFCKGIPVEDVTTDMLRPRQLVGRDAGPLSPIKREGVTDAELVDDHEAVEAERAAIAEVEAEIEALENAPDIDDVA